MNGFGQFIDRLTQDGILELSNRQESLLSVTSSCNCMVVFLFFRFTHKALLTERDEVFS